MDVSGVLHMRPPSPHKIRAAVTQAEVTAVSVPVLEGAEVDASFKVAIFLPLCDHSTCLSSNNRLSACLCCFWQMLKLVQTHSSYLFLLIQCVIYLSYVCVQLNL